MTSKLSASWFKGKSGKDKEDFELYIRNSADVLQVVLQEIQKMEEAIYNKEISEEQYKSDWQFLQAHRNGELSALRKLKVLFNHLEN